MKLIAVEGLMLEASTLFSLHIGSLTLINSLINKRNTVIVLVKSNQLFKKISRLNIFRKLKLDINLFLPPKHYKYGGCFSLLVGYNI